MRKNICNACLLLILLLLISACRKKELSSLVNQDRIYTDYHVSYNDYYNKTYARANFYLEDAKGKRIELSQNSRIFFAGVELESPTRKGTNYQATLNGFILNGEFDWNDTKGNHYFNSMPIPASLYCNNETIGSWGVAIGYDYYWHGDSLGLDEEVILNLSVSTDTSFSHEIVERTNGRNHVRIPSWILSQFSGRNVYVRITRTRFGTIQESPAAGGEISASYTSEGSWIYVW